jgi:hypothetical protein
MAARAAGQWRNGPLALLQPPFVHAGQSASVAQPLRHSALSVLARVLAGRR